MKINLQRETFSVGLFEVNASVLDIDGKAWIVDPGADEDRILAVIAEKVLTPEAILLTHAHFDHIGAVNGLMRRFPELKIYVGDADVAVITHPMNQLPPDYPPVELPANIVSATELDGSNGILAIETPGHTPGGVCYFIGEINGHEPLLLAGDTLFAGSVGRTDLPGGDMTKLVSSLKKLSQLPKETLVIPGHGPFTTIGEEIKSNPFM